MGIPFVRKSHRIYYFWALTKIVENSTIAYKGPDKKVYHSTKSKGHAS